MAELPRHATEKPDKRLIGDAYWGRLRRRSAALLDRAEPFVADAMQCRRTGRLAARVFSS